MIENLIGFQRAFMPSSYTEKQFRDQIKPVIVKFDQFKTKQECDYQFDKIINFYNDKKKCKVGVGLKAEEMDELNDRKYPQVEEFEQFIWFVQTIKRTYQFTLPDSSRRCIQKFQNFIACSQLLEQLRFTDSTESENFKLINSDIN